MQPHRCCSLRKVNVFLAFVPFQAIATPSIFVLANTVPSRLCKIEPGYEAIILLHILLEMGEGLGTKL